MPSVARNFRTSFGWVRDVSLQWKLSVPVACSLLLLFGLFAVLGEVLTDDSAQTMAADRMRVARLTARFLDRQFGQAFMQLEYLAAHVSLESTAANSEAEPWADLMRASNSFVSGVFLVDKSGQIVWADPPDTGTVTQNLATDEYLREPLVSGQRYVSPVFADPTTLRPTAIFSVAVFDSEGTPGGVLAATIDGSDPVFGILTSAAGEIREGGHAELVDQNLRLMASNERGHALLSGEHPTFYRPLLDSHESAVGLTDPIGDEDPEDRGQRHIMAFVPLNQVPWGLGIGGTESAFTALSARWRALTLPLGALAFGVAVFLVWITRRSVIRPIKALTRVSQRIASGDLTTPVAASGEGEVRLLARALDDMRYQLQQAQESEAELSRLKDEFLAIASHELRTPVAALTALTQLQRSRLARGQQISDHQALGEIHEQLERLARLVAHLLDSSRIQMGKLSLERQPADLTRLVEDAAEAVKVADAADRVVEIHAPASVPAIVDPLRIEQVLINLLENAVKHSPKGAPVQVDLCTPAPGTSRITVRDYGSGIPPAHRARVFDRYFQGSERNWGGPKAGLGLGLYVSREIVELHAGAISVEAPSDGGTSFVVTLPTGIN